MSEEVSGQAHVLVKGILGVSGMAWGKMQLIPAHLHISALTVHSN